MIVAKIKHRMTQNFFLHVSKCKIKKKTFLNKGWGVLRSEASKFILRKTVKL